MGPKVYFVEVNISDGFFKIMFENAEILEKKYEVEFTEEEGKFYLI